MKLEPVLLILLIATISLASAGCVRTAATWQPGVQQTTTAVQTTVDPNYAVDMMLFTPGEQRGKVLPATYMRNSGATGVVCRLAIDQLEPGDNGSITWMIKNTVMSEAELNLRPTIIPSPAGSNGSTNYIGIKLMCDDIYYLGDSANWVPLAKLMPYLQNRPSILASDRVTLYKLEWQVATSPVKAGPDGVFGTADDVPVDGKAIKQDTSTLDINFSLTPWR